MNYVVVICILLFGYYILIIHLLVHLYCDFFQVGTEIKQYPLALFVTASVSTQRIYNLPNDTLYL